jgi:hypothetical protein
LIRQEPCVALFKTTPSLAGASPPLTPRVLPEESSDAEITSPTCSVLKSSFLMIEE